MAQTLISDTEQPKIPFCPEYFQARFTLSAIVIGLSSSVVRLYELSAAAARYLNSERSIASQSPDTRYRSDGNDLSRQSATQFPARDDRVTQYLGEVNHAVSAAGPYPLVDLLSNGFLCID